MFETDDGGSDFSLKVYSGIPDAPFCWLVDLPINCVTIIAAVFCNWIIMTDNKYRQNEGDRNV